MDMIPTRLLAALEDRARKIGDRLAREVRVRHDTAAEGGPRVTLEARDNLGDYVPLVCLALPRNARGYRYTVRAIQPGAPADRFTFDTDAVRAVQAKALKTWHTLARRTGPEGARFLPPGSIVVTSSHKVLKNRAAQAPTPPRSLPLPGVAWSPPGVSWSVAPNVAAPFAAPTPTRLTAESAAATKVPEAPPPGESPRTFSGDEAVAHPVIRAAIIASHEAAKITGRTIDPLHVLTMADAALDVVAIARPGSIADAARLAEVERVLIGLLVGALSAAAN